MTKLRELQLFELQMLKDLVKVCDENDIEYFLAGGTLLGAVRHKGFIPWDDDVDIYMTTKNYKRFLKIGQKALGNKYFVQNYRTEKNYMEMWTQIRANGTTSMPLDCKNYDIHFGICLDIFPIVGVSDNEKQRKKQINALNINRTLLADSYMKVKGEEPTRKLKLLYLIPRFIRRFICKINERNIYLDSDKYNTNTVVWYKLTKDYPSRLLKSRIKIDFEDTSFFVMKDFHEFLTINFGDYMELPPENERKGHDLELGKIIFDANKDYREYKLEI